MMRLVVREHARPHELVLRVAPRGLRLGERLLERGYARMRMSVAADVVTVVVCVCGHTARGASGCSTLRPEFEVSSVDAPQKKGKAFTSSLWLARRCTTPAHFKPATSVVEHTTEFAGQPPRAATMRPTQIARMSEMPGGAFVDYSVFVQAG